jgi:hypothetical protein
MATKLKGFCGWTLKFEYAVPDCKAVTGVHKTHYAKYKFCPYCGRPIEKLPEE